LGVPTAIAGLYGVTFPNISELRVPHGYAVVVGVMLLMCLGL
jgi:magnesium transporter